MNKKLAYLYIVGGASLWGIIGVFVTKLYDLGFTPAEVVAIRALMAAIFLLCYTFIHNKKMLKIHIRDSRYFVGTGIVSIVFFNLCMFTAIKETSVSISAILLYTAPAFVMILSYLLFKETFTLQKVIALLMTFCGCAFVVGIFSNNTAISLYGLLAGLGSGFFYSLYSIFGKFALKKYESLTVTVYTFVFAAIAIVPFSGLLSSPQRLLHIDVLLYGIGLGFFSTMLAFLLYTKGLSYVESSRASIVATIEPVVAALASFLFFHERLDVFQYFGIILVISSIFIVGTSSSTKPLFKARSQNL
ncbi:DMT family transporter [Priestia endophytica]|jgi:drug/metabolite transporter (DMT)-like permease|uniref:DMT family transporter n=1 Tax=Priestia endophytica TaxID=135735 RepID=UPI002E231A66|nr:DMT family transporter [Priestia endophytica]